MSKLPTLELAGQTIVGLAMVVFAAIVISVQIMDRREFASGTLYRDVMERWGTPIVQPVPSVRAVESGSVFKRLESIPFARQKITVDASMNYRKRGLVYFSGFDFSFRGRYELANDRPHDMDLVFVFPINLEKNRVLLSELSFRVNGTTEPIDLTSTTDTLMWTGRLSSGDSLDFEIEFSGRGLHAFTYLLDPDLPVRNFTLDLNITGGDNFDYPANVVPSSKPEPQPDGVVLSWRFTSLESGVPVGVILPSEKSFDAIIARMVSRSWAGFLLFFVSLQTLAISRDRPLRWHEGLLLAAGYAFFSVLLPYLAAYWHFYVAYVVALLVVGGMLVGYMTWIVGTRELWQPAIVTASLVIPTFAVVMEGHTGLIYTLEILALLLAAMWLSTKPMARHLLTIPRAGAVEREAEHA